MEGNSSDGIAFGTGAGRWLIAVTVAGSGMAFLDSTVVNVALPKIGEDLHASTSALQWIINGYLLTLASLILLGGSLGDRLGRRRVFQAGVGLFTAASLLCAVAPTVDLLIVARLIQGVGGALLTPGSLAIIEASFRPADRARAIGAWSGLGGVATAFGPLLGGWLIGAISWRAIFVINLPIGIFVAVAASRHVPESRDPTATGKLDAMGAVLAAVGLGGATYALIEAPERGASAAVILTAAIGVASLIAFFVGERRSVNPMLPLSIFRSRQFSAANAVTFVVYAALGVVFFLLVSFLQISMGYSPSRPASSLAADHRAHAARLGAGGRAGAADRAADPADAGAADHRRRAAPDAADRPGGRYVGDGAARGGRLRPRPDPGGGAGHRDGAGGGRRRATRGSPRGRTTRWRRVAGLLAVAVIPVVAGLTGHKFEPSHMTHGFHMGMVVCAILAALGAVVAWTTISCRRPPRGRRKPEDCVRTTAARSAPRPSAPAAADSTVRPTPPHLPQRHQVDGPKTASHGWFGRHRGAAEVWQMSGVRPPSTGTVAPVMAAAPGPRRKAIVAATSSGASQALQRWRGAKSRGEGRSKRRADSARRGVSVEPGATALAVTPLPCRSAARPRTKPVDSRLRRAVGGEARHPPRRARRGDRDEATGARRGVPAAKGYASRPASITDSRLTLSRARCCSAGSSQAGTPPAITPALATKASRSPQRFGALDHRGERLAVGASATTARATSARPAPPGRRDRFVELALARHRVRQPAVRGAAVDGDHAPALGGERGDGRGADPAAGPGDDRDAPGRHFRCAPLVDGAKNRALVEILEPGQRSGPRGRAGCGTSDSW